ncbi:MAG: DUF1731 domain-containing protein, partial [Nitrospira sp.]
IQQGELGTIMTTGQWVIPAKALADGYRFQYPALESALRVALKRTIASGPLSTRHDPHPTIIAQ